LGMLFAWLVPDAQAAQIAGITVVQIAQIFSGIMVPYGALPGPMRWLNRASIIKYAMEGLIATQLVHVSDSPVICVPYGRVAPADSLAGRLHLCTADGSGALGRVVGLVSTASEYASHEFLPDYRWENRWLDLGVLVGVAVGVKVMQWVVMRVVSHNSR